VRALKSLEPELKTIYLILPADHAGGFEKGNFADSFKVKIYPQDASNVIVDWAKLGTQKVFTTRIKTV